MRIRMLETRRGSEDGFCIRLYEKGKEYEVGNLLAYTFITSGFAVVVASTTFTQGMGCP